jgi:hypothetical protein
MLAAKTLIATALLALTLPALAGTTLLDFEQISATTTALAISKPYTGLGIDFGANAYGIVSSKARVNPGEGNFYRDLDADGKTSNRGALFLWDGQTDTGFFSFFINVADGFDTSFALSYTSGLNAAGSVQVFSEKDGGGESLGGVVLQGSASCANTAYLCTWKDESVDLKGKIGRSILISGSNAQFIFDDFKLNLHSGSGQVPEPGGVALSLAALGALAWSRSKRRAV